MGQVRVHTPDEARAMFELERADQEFRTATMRLEMARAQYEHILEEREHARRRGHLRLVRRFDADPQGA
jgi:hypothetical protein